MLSACGEKPPVGSVENPCATALYRSMFGACPSRYSPYSKQTSNTVNPK
jgi:hypothetical protein